MLWLCKATGEFRSIEVDRKTDAEVRVTYEVPSTRSLIACRRLSYLSSFSKASPFLLALLQHNGRLHPWVRQIQIDLQAFQAATPKLAAMPHQCLGVDAWVRFAAQFKGTWKKRVVAWIPLAS